MAIKYEDLYNKSGTIYNKKTSKGYASPTDLARDLGVSAEQIQWGNIGEYKAPPAPTQQQSPQVDYSQLVNRGGTIYNTQTNQGYQNPQQLASAMGVKDIDWSKIAQGGQPQAQPAPTAQPTQTAQAQPQQQGQQPDYSQLVNKGGTIENTQTGKAYENPEQLSQDLGVGTEQIDWQQIAKAEPITYQNLENREGTIVNPNTGKAYSNPDELARDLGIQSDQIDWEQIAQGTTSTPDPQTGQQVEAPPEVSKEVTEAYNKAFELYQKSQELSPEELSTQEELDKLMEATSKAYQNTSDQAIPLQFITGQLKSIENRALGLMEPLEAKMARMQAKRTGAMEASKTALEKASSDLDYQRGQVSSYYEQQEEARQFDVETGLKFQKELQDAMQFEQKLQLDYQKEIAGQELDYAKLQQKEQADLRAYNLSEAKYNEDVRQYGLDYAQKNRQIAISASKEARLGSGGGGDITVDGLDTSFGGMKKYVEQAKVENPDISRDEMETNFRDYINYSNAKLKEAEITSILDVVYPKNPQYLNIEKLKEIYPEDWMRDWLYIKEEPKDLGLGGLTSMLHNKEWEIEEWKKRLSKEKIENEYKEWMEKVERLRKQGLTDKQIEKELFED